MALLREPQQWQMHLNVSTYSGTVSACEKGQPWITAVALLREMQQWQMRPNIITYNGAITACQKGQQWISAVALLREVQQWQMQADDITHNYTGLDDKSLKHGIHSDEQRPD